MHLFDLENRIIHIKHSIYNKPKDDKGRWYIGTTKTKLIAVSCKANKERIATTEITVEVENLEEKENLFLLFKTKVYS